jgi:hypothetical protein
MRQSQTVSIAPIRDSEPEYFDFTPDTQRQYARQLDVQQSLGRGSVKVTLAEQDRDDPTQLRLVASVEGTPYRCQSPELVADIYVEQLDGLIAALTTARDLAIAEGMIEPATA